jgi:hypothetical protein
MTRIEQPNSTNVSIERNGRTYTGRYLVAGDLITVRYDSDQKATQIGGSPHEALAKILLGELVPKN